MTWKEVTTSDLFRSAGAEERAEYKRQFFERYGVKTLRDQGLNDDEIQIAASEFFNRPDDTGEGLIRSALGSAARGFFDPLAAAPEVAGAYLGIEGLEEFGGDVRGAIEGAFPVNPAEQGLVTDTFGVLGQVGQIVATGGGGAVAGAKLLGKGATEAAKRQAMKFGATAAQQTAMGSSAVAGGLERAEQLGLEGGDRLLRGAIAGGTELLAERLGGFATELGPINKFMGQSAEEAWFKPIIRGVGTEALEEGGAEAAGQATDIAMAPEAAPGMDLKNIGYAMLLGGVGGAAFGGIEAAITPRTKKAFDGTTDFIPSSGPPPGMTVEDAEDQDLLKYGNAGEIVGYVLPVSDETVEGDLPLTVDTNVEPLVENVAATPEASATASALRRIATEGAGAPAATQEIPDEIVTDETTALREAGMRMLTGQQIPTETIPAQAETVTPAPVAEEIITEQEDQAALEQQQPAQTTDPIARMAAAGSGRSIIGSDGEIDREATQKARQAKADAMGVSLEEFGDIEAAEVVASKQAFWDSLKDGDVITWVDGSGRTRTAKVEVTKRGTKSVVADNGYEFDPRTNEFIMNTDTLSVSNPTQQQNVPLTQETLQQEQSRGQELQKPRELPILPAEPTAQAPEAAVGDEAAVDIDPISAMDAEQFSKLLVNGKIPNSLLDRLMKERSVDEAFGILGYTTKPDYIQDRTKAAHAYHVMHLISALKAGQPISAKAIDDYGLAQYMEDYQGKFERKGNFYVPKKTKASEESPSAAAVDTQAALDTQGDGIVRDEGIVGADAELEQQKATLPVDGEGAMLQGGDVRQEETQQVSATADVPTESLPAGQLTSGDVGKQGAVKPVTPEQVQGRIQELLRAPTKSTKKPAVSFKTQTEENAFARGFESATKKQGESLPPRMNNRSAKDQRWDEAWAKGWSSGQAFIRSLPDATPPPPPQPQPATPATQETKPQAAALATQPATQESTAAQPAAGETGDAGVADDSYAEDKRAFLETEEAEWAKQSRSEWDKKGGKDAYQRRVAVWTRKKQLSGAPSYEQWLKQGNNTVHMGAVSDAVTYEAPVSVSAVETYGIEIPEGYVKQGDIYVFAPQAPETKASSDVPETDFANIQSPLGRLQSYISTLSPKDQQLWTPERLAAAEAFYNTGNRALLDIMPRSLRNRVYENNVTESDKDAYEAEQKRQFALRNPPAATDSQFLEDYNAYVNSLSDETLQQERESREEAPGVSDARYSKQLESLDKKHAELEKRAKAGDKAAAAEAERMVAEAAKGAGFTERAFKAMPETDWKTGEPIRTVNSINGPWAGFFTDSVAVAERFGRIMRQPVLNAFLKIKKPFTVNASGKAAGELQFDIIDDSGEFAQKNNAEILTAIRSGEYDSVVLKDTVDEGTVTVPIDPNQIKSADPFTYNDAGKLIPLSQRFQQDSPDIRYSRILRSADGNIRRTGVKSTPARAARNSYIGVIPGVENTWLGTVEEFDAEFPDGYPFDSKTTTPPADTEALVAEDGRAFIFIDRVQVLDGDAERAEQHGTSPGVEAIKRLLRHESFVHRGFMSLPGPLKARFADFVASGVIPEAELDYLANGSYPQYKGWRDNKTTEMLAAEEWLAQRVERMGRIPQSGPIASIMDWLRDVWRWLTGGETTDLDKLRNTMRAMHKALGALDPKQRIVMEVPDAEMLRRSYIGERAIENMPEERKQFMRDSLDTAKAMAAAGKSSEEIRAVTGWFQGIGKGNEKLRWELPDNDAVLKKSETIAAGYPANQVLIHDSLFEQYPELGSVKVAFVSMPDGQRGRFNNLGNGMIEVNRNLNDSDKLSTLLHEIQHWIQYEEGFARGGTPAEMQISSKGLSSEVLSFLDSWRSVPREIQRNFRKEYRDSFGENPPLDMTSQSAGADILRWIDIASEINSQEVIDVILPFYKAWEVRHGNISGTSLGISDARLEAYRRLAGEIEARDIQARQNFTPAQRAATAPYSSENIAPEDAIVMFGGSGSQASMARRSVAGGGITPEIQDLRDKLESLELEFRDIANRLGGNSDEASEAFDRYSSARNELRNAEIQARHPGTRRLTLAARDEALGPLQALAGGRDDTGYAVGRRNWKRGKKERSHPDLGDVFAAEGSGALFRSVSLEDYARIKKSGFIDTDFRGAISKAEGINLTPDTATAANYIPSGGTGVILAIDTKGLDLKFISADDYIRSFEPIPATAIVAVSDPITIDAESGSYMLHDGAVRYSKVQRPTIGAQVDALSFPGVGTTSQDNPMAFEREYGYLPAKYYKMAEKGQVADALQGYAKETVAPYANSKEKLLELIEILRDDRKILDTFGIGATTGQAGLGYIYAEGALQAEKMGDRVLTEAFAFGRKAVGTSKGQGLVGEKFLVNDQRYQTLFAIGSVDSTRRNEQQAVVNAKVGKPTAAKVGAEFEGATEAARDTVADAIPSEIQISEKVLELGAAVQGNPTLTERVKKLISNVIDRGRKIRALQKLKSQTRASIIPDGGDFENMSEAELEAEIARLTKEIEADMDFIEKEVAKTPRTQAPKTPVETAKAIINRVQKQAAGETTRAKPKLDRVRLLYKAHLRERMAEADFMDEAKAAGLTQQVAQELYDAAELEIAAILLSKEVRGKSENYDKLTRERLKHLDVDSSALVEYINRLRREGKLGPVNWRDIMQLPPTRQQVIKGTLLELVKQNPQLQNLSAEEQQTLADALEKVWERERERQFKLQVKRLEMPGAKQEDQEKVVSATPRIIKLINQGMLAEDAFYKAVGEQFGIKEMSDADRKRIMELSEIIQNDTIARADKAKEERELVTLLQKYHKLTTAEILSNVWVAHVLSGVRTQTDMFLGFLNGLLNTVKKAGLVIYKNPNAKGVKAGAKGVQQFFVGLADGMAEAARYVKTEEPGLVRSDIEFINSYLEGGLKKGGLSTARKLRESDNKFLSALGSWLAILERVNTGWDVMNYRATYQGTLAMAHALNPKLYKEALMPTTADFKAMEERAKTMLGAGATRAQIKSRAFQYIEDGVHLLGKNLDESFMQEWKQMAAEFNYDAKEAAMMVDPTGIGGLFYRGIMGITEKAETAAKARADKAKEELLNPTLGRDQRFIRQVFPPLMYLLASQARNILGVRFIRFTGNKINELISYIPIAGMARIYLEEGMTRNNELTIKAMSVQMNQLIATAIMIPALIKAMYDLEDDDEERGYIIQGPWDNLTPERKSQLMADGFKPNTIAFYSKKTGRWTSWNYINWPSAGWFATAGSVSDYRRYTPEKWDEKTAAAKLMSGIYAGGSSFLDISSISQMTELFGRSTYSTDPATKGLEKVTKLATGYAGGFVPRIAKDVDSWFDKTVYKPEDTWGHIAKEMPFYRRGAGKQLRDIFYEPVEISRTPWSRALQVSPDDPAYKALGRLNSRGIWLTPANPENRKVKRGGKLRDMTDEEANAYMAEVGKRYKEFVVKQGDRLLEMDVDRAEELVSKYTARIREIAFKKAIASSVKTATR